jgi:oxygen-dependent protoporphyrinogen oxidase
VAEVTPRHVVVVGAGISGLTAAWELSRSGECTVEVLEAADHVGGVLQRTEIGGVTVDVGAESMLARRPEGVALIHDVGLGGNLVHPATTRASVRSPGRLAPLPAGTLMGVPRSADAVQGFLDPADVGRVRAEPELPAPPLEHDVAVADYVAARVGQAVVDRLVEPLLGGVYAGHAARLSLQATVPALWRHAVRGGSLLEAIAEPPVASPAPVFAGLDGGLATLPPTLAARLRERGVTIATSSPVARVERRRTGWLVDGRPADAVVLAVPAPAAARLLSDTVPAAAAELREIETASMVITALAVPAAELTGLTGSGVLVPPAVAAREGLRAKALTLSGNKWGWVGAQNGDVAVLRVSAGRAGETDVLEADDADVVRWAVADASRLLGRDLHPVDTDVVRWFDGLPQYAVGHVDRVARLRAALAGVPGLALCGSVLDGVGVPACIGAAQRAAAEVRAQWAAA